MQQPPTILIADDQKHMLTLLQSTVSRIACRIVTAASGEEALAQAAATTIDLLLIDFQMSGLTGVETVRELKTNPAYADLPVILITGRGQNRIRTEAIRAGISQVISKPFSPVELIETIRRLLPHHDGVPASDAR